MGDEKSSGIPVLVRNPKSRMKARRNIIEQFCAQLLVITAQYVRSLYIHFHGNLCSRAYVCNLHTSQTDA